MFSFSNLSHLLLVSLIYIRYTFISHYFVLFCTFYSFWFFDVTFLIKFVFVLQGKTLHFVFRTNYKICKSCFLITLKLFWAHTRFVSVVQLFITIFREKATFFDLCFNLKIQNHRCINHMIYL